MTKYRALILISTIIIVGLLGYVLSLYARGYRFNAREYRYTPTGLLVIKSNPDGAEVNIDGELKAATNANLSLAPDTYDIEIKKEGYHTWSKRIEMFKEEVTEIDAYLFKTAPSLSAITFTSSVAPSPSKDFTKIAYGVPANAENIKDDKEGLWVFETINLPVGFARDPRRVADGDLADTQWQWSPDGRQILLTTSTGSYLLEAGSFTSERDRVNITSTVDELLEKWQIEEEKKLNAQIKGLPEELVEVLENAIEVVFSPDEKMVLYTADTTTTLSDELIKPVPGASTQKQNRDIIPNHTYVYSIKEDRNFLITDDGANLTITNKAGQEIKRRIAWFPSSRQLLVAGGEKVVIMDIDGTNKQAVYTGSYVTPNAFSIVSQDRIIILTNLGANSSDANLYSLGIK